MIRGRLGFAVVYPQQQLANNPKNCFSWFLPGDTARGHGEALSIREMVEHAIATFAADRGKVFVTGLSAGGAMASVMLATYPEVFAGGALIAGFPYGRASLKRWSSLTRFTDDGRLCMSNNAAERELRAIAVGRRNCTFAGSDEGGRRAAAIYTLVATAKLNDVDPQAWLADVLARLPDHPAKCIHELLPWNWRPPTRIADAA
jgi:poly(3-hydroxybutyrate) depolymerase